LKILEGILYRGKLFFSWKATLGACKIFKTENEKKVNSALNRPQSQLSESGVFFDFGALLDPLPKKNPKTALFSL